jgi:hypothetical protein
LQEKRNVYRVVVQKYERITSLEDPDLGGKNITKIELKETHF